MERKFSNIGKNEESAHYEKSQVSGARFTSENFNNELEKCME